MCEIDDRNNETVICIACAKRASFVARCKTFAEFTEWKKDDFCICCTEHIFFYDRVFFYFQFYLEKKTNQSIEKDNMENL